MPLNKVYTQSQEGANVSYDYFDIAAGIGIQNFYGYIISKSEAVSGGLSSSSNTYSFPIATDKAKTDSAGVRELNIEKDFDVTFNFPRNIKGKTIINIPQAIVGGSAAHTMTSQVHTYVIKYDGTTETTLAQGSGAILVKPSTGTTQEQMAAIFVDIPKTHFKGGETLRLTVQTWDSVQTGGTSTTFTLGHDPKNRAFTSSFTNVDRNLLLPVPFVIDL